METAQELQHWGIKGQKWGIRRYQNEDGTLTEAGKKRYYYQNPDGSLTEEGKKHYMTAARKGKLNPKKLSDADLNMINQRFAREKTYKQNVKEYEESKFSYKLKNAIIDRVKGNGGGGGKKGGGGGGGKGIASLLAMPIKKAFEDALKFDPNNKANKLDYSKEDAERAERKEMKRLSEHGNRFVSKYVSDVKDEQVNKAFRQKDVDRGRAYLGHGKGKMDVSSSAQRLGKTDATRTGNSVTEKMLRDRRKARADAEYSRTQEAKEQRREENRQKSEQNRRKRERELEERAAKSGIYLGHSETRYVVKRASDYLAHHGIKGQKWGVRRFQNADGTWTEAGKERYGSDDDSEKSKKDLKREAKDMNSLMKGARKAFRPGNWSESEKLSKSDKIDKLADDKELISKAKKVTDLQNKLHAIVNRNEEYERKLGVYGDDLDGWDEKTGKENYGIDAKQFNQVMKNRSEYKTVKAEQKQAESEYRQATMAKSESFVKDYMSKSYAKVKDEGDSLARYSEYVNHLLNVNLDNRVSI